MKKAFFLAVALFVSPIVTHASFDTNLSYGSRGASVVELQKFLTDQGVFTGTPSGNYFSVTRTAVKAYQVKVGISPASGFWGPMTRAKAQASLVKTPVQVTETKKVDTSLQDQVDAVARAVANTKVTPDPIVVTTKDNMGNIIESHTIGSPTSLIPLEVYKVEYIAPLGEQPYVNVSVNKEIDPIQSKINGTVTGTSYKTSYGTQCQVFSNDGTNKLKLTAQEQSAFNQNSQLQRCNISPIVYHFPIKLPSGMVYSVHLVGLEGDTADLGVKVN